FASPAYLEGHGVPRSLEDLRGHEMIGFASSRTGQVLPLEFTVEGEVRTTMLPYRITVTNTDTYANLARLGFGLMQAPRYRYAEDLAAGRLMEVLHQHPPSPTPISVLYPKSRQLSPRVRVFIDWLVRGVAPKICTLDHRPRVRARACLSSPRRRPEALFAARPGGPRVAAPLHAATHRGRRRHLAS